MCVASRWLPLEQFLWQPQRDVFHFEEKWEQLLFSGPDRRRFHTSFARIHSEAENTAEQIEIFMEHEVDYLLFLQKDESAVDLRHVNKNEEPIRTIHALFQNYFYS